MPRDHAAGRAIVREVGAGIVRQTPPRAEPIDGLCDFLTIQAWADRPLPPPEPLLGHLVTKNTRLFLVGTTGLGKTMLGFALAEGIAAGTGFLHWRSSRPARVLYIDGEMASELIKARSLDALRRAEMVSKPGMLTIYARDFEEQIAAQFPGLGRMSPLNTEDGHRFVYSLIAAVGGADVVIFDNVMSLMLGDQKDELTWNDVLPLASGLTERGIGQIWFDHTGHDKTRQYGASVKAWRFDSVGIMTPLPDEQRARHEVAFQLSFEPPGKARRRTPDNWGDFETCIIRLADDRWTSEIQGKPAALKAKVSAIALALLRALHDALVISPTPGETTRNAWYAEGARLGLLDPIAETDSRAEQDRKRAKLRKYLGELKAASLIGVDGETVRTLQKGDGN